MMGIVEAVLSDIRGLKVSNESFEKWRKGAETVDFVVAEDVDISAVDVGSQIHFTFFVHGEHFMITDLMIHPQMQHEGTVEEEKPQGMQHD